MMESKAFEPLTRRTKSLAALFLLRTKDNAEREAFRFPVTKNGVDEWKSMTWKAAGERVHAIAGGLRSLGLVAEERVGVLSGTRVEWILADLGVLCAGGATTTVYPSTTAEDCAFILDDSASKFVVVEDKAQLDKLRSQRSAMSKLSKVILIDGERPAADGDWVMTLPELEALGKTWLAANPGEIEKIVEAIQPEQIATLVYTSGTTGKPKGVRLVQECWAYTADGIDATGLWQRDEIQFLWLPMAHVFGKVLMCGHLMSGSVTAIDGRIPKIIDNLAVVRPTLMAAAPRIFEKVYNKVIQGIKEKGGFSEKIFRWAVAVGKRGSVVKQEGKTPGGLLALQLALAEKLVFSKIKQRFGGRLRFFISGSAPLSREIAEFFHACGILILEGYGLTESSAASSVNRLSKYRFGTVGIPLPGTTIRLAESDSEILIKSPGVMRGYHNLPEQTAEALTADGWLHTGDIGEIDADGFIRITDRKKDLIKTSGGKYVAPQMIEGKLKAACPYLSQVVVHGDTRNFCSALFSVDEEAVMKWARENGLGAKSYAEVTKSPELRALIEPYVEEVNQSLAKWETIKKFAILPRDLTIEEGELTPSLKVKRKAVEQKYKSMLDKLYEGALAD
ncbi:MAG: long-chain fatty acid--CoA ligase [Sandaracinaceae bacterium]|nr:long-chain fatty acid--CoA ligase [Sandaracinaceae bacterium]